MSVYEQHLNEIDREAERARSRILQLQKRKYRKHRDAFKALLDDLQEQGKLNKDSLWRTIYPDLAEVSI